MSKRDDTITLGDMLDFAIEARELVDGMSEQQYTEDRLRILATTRLIEIIGEAATRLSAEFRNSHPELPWGQMIGMRNRLIHAYDHVEASVLWQTLQESLPSLIQSLEAILKQD
ncbi:MAG: DUF86 domain-containing protein [Leptospiraceae bacterium]|nr:DUF86 domain-containing protein [Leptospiraceae bacterium]